MIKNLFSTPLYIAKFEEPVFSLVQESFEQVYQDLKQKNTFDRQKGWRGTHLINDPTFNSNLITDYKINIFKGELLKHVITYLTHLNYNKTTNYNISESWMTISNKNDYAYAHTHGPVDLCGVYYFKTNSKDGKIIFRNPNFMLNASWCYNSILELEYITPEEGMLILFPSWLLHNTEPNTTDNERISISFNLLFSRHSTVS